MRFIPTAIVLLVLSCSGSEVATEPEYTHAHVHHGWKAAYDQPWQDVLNCWQVVIDKPDVLIMPCIDDHYFIDSWGREVHGYTLEDTVVVCPDLAALRHEMSHYTSYVVRGHYGTETRGGCFDVG